MMKRQKKQTEIHKWQRSGITWCKQKKDVIKQCGAEPRETKWAWNCVKTAGPARGAAHLGRGGGGGVRRVDQAALAGGGPVGGGSSGRGSRPPTPVAEAGHHLGGSLWEDELLSQLHVRPAFSWEAATQTSVIQTKVWVHTSRVVEGFRVTFSWQQILETVTERGA